MESLTLRIAGEKTVFLQIDNPSEAQKTEVIRRAFGLFKEESSSITFSFTPLIFSDPISSPEKESMEKEAPPSSTNKSDDAEVSTENVSNKADELPEHHKTGIKMKDGIPHYRCRYKCSKCKKESNQYIKEGARFTDCHGCGTSLVVRKATNDFGLVPDVFKNFYVAGEMHPVKVVRA